MKKLLTAIALLTAVITTSAKADSIGTARAKAEHFAMVSEALKIQMEFFVVQPQVWHIEKITALTPQFVEAMDDMDSKTMAMCKADDSCNYYFQMGIDNLDAIDYLKPKMLKVAQQMDSN